MTRKRPPKRFGAAVIRRLLLGKKREEGNENTKNENLGVILAGYDGRRGYIHHTCVDPTLWNNRIGTRLVETALEALRIEGISKVALVVFFPESGKRL